jgi:surface polysaccharide O-acyltransferase-like enzyme
MRGLFCQQVCALSITESISQVLTQDGNAVPVESFEWRWFNIYDGLMRFCVSAFVMISGVFFLTQKRDSLTFILK